MTHHALLAVLVKNKHAHLHYLFLVCLALPMFLLAKNWDYLMGNYRIQIAKIQHF